jgi:hypothetical protein
MVNHFQQNSKHNKFLKCFWGHLCQHDITDLEEIWNESVVLMPWSALSPDVNPIDHARNEISR